MSKKANEESEIKRYFWSRSTIILIASIAFVSILVMSLHPFNQEWAWEIAKALITVAGLILGFTILGVTVVSERGLSKPRMTSVFEKHFRKFCDELRVVEVTDTEKLKKKIVSTAKTATFEIAVVPQALFVAMYFLFASLLLALMLFGVDDSVVNNSILAEIFTAVLVGSITCLVFGVHLTFKVLKDLVTRANDKELLEAFQSAFNTIMQELKEKEKKG